ncbi:MAG: KH domain-containing protein [Eubacteriales bacterium]|nr:KH domain-containing protein [Eubacteriales bacterium]
MEALLKHLVEALIDQPEELKIERKERANGVVFEIRVAPDDMGKVIGRNGRRAQAIRQIMKAKGMRSGERVYVDILD